MRLKLGTIYVPFCEGISGEVGCFVVYDFHTDGLYDIHIDTPILDSTRKDIDDNDFAVEAAV